MQQVSNTHTAVKDMSDEDRDKIIGILKEHFLFKKLPKNEFDQLLDLMDEKFAGEGEEIITEGARARLP